MYKRQVKAILQVDNMIHKMDIGYFSLCNFITMYTQSSWAHRTSNRCTLKVVSSTEELDDKKVITH